MDSRLLTIDAVAAILHVSPRTVQREIDAGAISTVRVRRLVRTDNSALWSLFREHAETNGLSHIETTLLGKAPCVVGPGQKLIANIPERLADEAQRHGFEIVSADLRRGVYVLKVTSLPDTASGE